MRKKKAQFNKIFSRFFSRLFSRAVIIFMVLSLVFPYQVGAAFLTGGNLPNQFANNGTSIYYTSGNLGVGTSAPGASLDVVGQIRSSSWISAANGFGLTVRNSANTAYRTAILMDSSNILKIGQDSDIAALTFGVGSEQMRINFSGNVGIGTTNPWQKLDVGGIIRQGSYLVSDAATDNMLVNGDFEMGSNYGWNTGTVVTGGYSGNYALQIAGGANLNNSDYIPVDPTKDVFQLEAWVKKSVAGSTPGVLYFGYYAYDANKNIITTAPCGTYCYFAASGYVIPADGAWHKISATTVGEGTSSPNFPVGTRYVQVMGLINYSASGDAVTLIDHVTLKRLTKGPLIAGNYFSSANLVDQNQYTTLYTTSGNNLVISPPGSGNVGIAKASPTVTLDVTGSGSFTGTVNGTGLCIGGDCKTSWAAVGSASSGWTQNGAEVYKTNTSGNVGIGTTAPGVKLQVAGGIRSTSGQIDVSPTEGSFRFYDGTTFRGGLGTGQWAAVGGAGDIIQYQNGVNYYISNGSTPLVKVDTTGNVGIGTTNPTRKLSVSAAAGNGSSIGLFTNLTGTEQEIFRVSNTGSGVNDGMLTLSENGVTKVLIGANNTRSGNTYFNGGGNVGIGTTAPLSNLHVYGNTNGGVSLFLQNAANNTAASTGLSMGPGSGSNFNIITYPSSHSTRPSSVLINSDSGVANGILIAPDAGGVNISGAGTGNRHLSVAPSGNVGIAKTNPAVALDVVGAGSFSSTVNATGLCISSDCKTSWAAVGAASSGWSQNGNEVYKTATAGNVGIGTTAPVAKLSVFANGTSPHSSPTGISVSAGAGGGNLLALTASDNHNWFPYTDGNNYYSAANHIFRGGTGNTPEYVRINSSGNLGIGTTAPGGKLDVNGTIRQGAILARPLATWSANGNSTGAVIIKLPGNTGNYGMLHIVINTYEYGGNVGTTYICSGHNWSNAWYNYSCNTIGVSDKAIRLVVKDGQYAIVLGGQGVAWSYGHVVLSEVTTGGYYSGVMDLGGTYTIIQDNNAESWTWASANLNSHKEGSIYANGLINAGSSVNGTSLCIAGDCKTAWSQVGSTNADTVDSQHFTWSNVDNNPSYLWGANTNGSSFLVARGSMNVNYANTAGSATTAGSAGNADTADGLHVHSGTNNEANKIVRTDVNGYIQAGWINTISGDNGTTAINRVYASSDAYLRYYTPTNFRTVLDVPTRGGSGASGTWGINITGNAGYASSAGSATTATSASNADTVDSIHASGFWQASGSWKPSSLSGATRLVGMSTPDSGDMGVAYQSGQAYIYTDGWFYQNEGQYRVLDTSNSASLSVNYANTAGSATTAGSASTVSSLAGTWTGLNYFLSNLGATSGSLSSPPLQVYATGGNSAFMSFHRSGSYAVNMGLDSDNVLRIGGWSAGANRWQLDMNGNQTLAGALITANAASNWGDIRTGSIDSNTVYAYNSVCVNNGSGSCNAASGVVLGIDNNSAFSNFPSSGDSFVGGNLGVGVATPSYPLHLYKASSETGILTSWGTTNVYLSHGGWGMGAGRLGIGNGSVPTIVVDSTTNNVGIGITNPSTKLYVSGDVTASAYYYSSDKTLKTNIKTLDNSLDKILQLRGVSFDWKKDGKPSMGLIAQEVKQVYPELINGEDGNLSIQYGNLVAPLIESIKEQQGQISAQQGQILIQQSEIEKLKTRINNLERNKKNNK